MRLKESGPSTSGYKVESVHLQPGGSRRQYRRSHLPAGVVFWSRFPSLWMAVHIRVSPLEPEDSLTPLPGLSGKRVFTKARPSPHRRGWPGFFPFCMRGRIAGHGLGPPGRGAHGWTNNLLPRGIHDPRILKVMPGDAPAIDFVPENLLPSCLRRDRASPHRL